MRVFAAARSCFYSWRAFRAADRLPLSLKALCDPQRRRGTVMTVGNIKRGQGFDRSGQRGDGFVGADDPKLMADAVVGGDVDRGVAGGRIASMPSSAGAVG